MTTLLTMKGFNKKIDYLCFTANTDGSQIRIYKQGSPTEVSLETSTDGNTWTDYTINTYLTLSSVWDKVYFRNKSTTDTWFSTSTSNYYRFQINWSIGASWDITYLLNKNGTTKLISNYCFYNLFYSLTNLTTAPSLPATTLRQYCYTQMFYWCTNLTTLPQLPSTAAPIHCYNMMFAGCSKIKLSTTQTWEYQTPYRIPTEWTWTTWNYWNYQMFYNTWWTFTWNPTINTTYYTSNTVV